MNTKLASIIARREQIARKFSVFLDKDIEPASYLYRHYDPNGDLLYVGITIDGLKRQLEHSKEAAWRTMIYAITIEPFATREKALIAEVNAIRTEFPKYNITYNDRPHPLDELARWEIPTGKRVLTDKAIRILKPAPAGKRYEVHDAIVPGMSVRVTERGHKTYVLGARYPGSPHFKVCELGEVGAITLSAARDKAREWLVHIKAGRDPRDVEREATVVQV